MDVRCYQLVSLFLCSLFVPKCSPSGTPVPPCATLCNETMHRCGFFFDVFGLSLPDYLNCKLFKDFDDPDECIGMQQVHNVNIEQRNPSRSFEFVSTHYVILSLFRMRWFQMRH